MSLVETVTVEDGVSGGVYTSISEVDVLQNYDRDRGVDGTGASLKPYF